MFALRFPFFVRATTEHLHWFMRVKHVAQASGPGAYHTPRLCEYCYIRANLVEGSFRLEMGPLTQWSRPFFRQFRGILEDSHKGCAGNRREFVSKRRN
jgi:hypothetical protein